MQTFTIIVNELARALALLEPLAMVRRKVVERIRRLGVSAQGLEAHEHVVCLPLALDRHEPRDTPLQVPVMALSHV